MNLFLVNQDSLISTQHQQLALSVIKELINQIQVQVIVLPAPLELIQIVRDKLIVNLRISYLLDS